MLKNKHACKSEIGITLRLYFNTMKDQKHTMNSENAARWKDDLKYRMVWNEATKRIELENESPSAKCTGVEKSAASNFHYGGRLNQSKLRNLCTSLRKRNWRGCQHQLASSLQSPFSQTAIHCSLPRPRPWLNLSARSVRYSTSSCNPHWLSAPSCHDGSPTTPWAPISPAEHHSRCSGRCRTSPFPSLPQGGSWQSHIAGDSSDFCRSGWSGQQPLGSAVSDHT